MKKLITVLLSILLIPSSFAMLSNTDSVLTNKIDNNPVVQAYEDLTNGSQKYDTKNIQISFDKFYRDNSNSIQKKGRNFSSELLKIIDKDHPVSEEKLLWLKQNFMGNNYMLAGFVKHATDKGKNEEDAKKIYQQIWDDYLNKLKNLDTNITVKEYALNYNSIGFKNSISKLYAGVKFCEGEKPCLEKHFNNLQNTNDIFNAIAVKCSDSNKKEIDKCRVNFINSEYFQKNVSYIDYRVGYYLFDIVK